MSSSDESLRAVVAAHSRRPQRRRLQPHNAETLLDAERQLRAIFTVSEPEEVGGWLSTTRAGISYVKGASVPSLAPEFSPTRGGFLVPQALARRPEPGDMIGTYVTDDEILGQSLGLDSVIGALRDKDLLSTLAVCAALFRAVTEAPLDPVRDRAIARSFRPPLRRASSGRGES